MFGLPFLALGETGFLGRRALSASSIFDNSGVLEISLLAIYCIFCKAVWFFYAICYIITNAIIFHHLSESASSANTSPWHPSGAHQQPSTLPFNSGNWAMSYLFWRMYSLYFWMHPSLPYYCTLKGLAQMLPVAPRT